MITLVDSVDVEVALPSFQTLDVFDHKGDAEKIAVLRARGDGNDSDGGQYVDAYVQRLSRNSGPVQNQLLLELSKRSC